MSARPLISVTNGWSGNSHPVARHSQPVRRNHQRVDVYLVDLKTRGKIILGDSCFSSSLTTKMMEGTRTSDPAVGEPQSARPRRRGSRCCSCHGVKEEGLVPFLPATHDLQEGGCYPSQTTWWGGRDQGLAVHRSRSGRTGRDARVNTYNKSLVFSVQNLWILVTGFALTAG